MAIGKDTIERAHKRDGSAEAEAAQAANRAEGAAHNDRNEQPTREALAEALKRAESVDYAKMRAVEGGMVDVTDLNEVAQAVNEEHRRFQVAGKSFDVTLATREAIHVVTTAKGALSIAPVNPHGEPAPQTSPAGKPPASLAEKLAEDQKLAEWYARNPGLRNPAIHSDPGCGGPFGGSPIR